MSPRPDAPCANGRERHRWNPGRRPSRQRCDYCKVNRAEYAKRYRFTGLRRAAADVRAYRLAA